MKQPTKAKKQKSKVVYRYVGSSTLYQHLAGSSHAMLYNICYHFDNTAILSIIRFGSTEPLDIFQRICIHLMCDANLSNPAAGSTQNVFDFYSKIANITNRQTSSRFMFKTHDALKYASLGLLDFVWYKNTIRPYFVRGDEIFLDEVIPRTKSGKRAKIKWMGFLD